MNASSGTPSNPTTLRTNSTPRCGYCAALLIAKSELHWCGTCGVWFRVMPVEVVGVGVMI